MSGVREYDGNLYIASLGTGKQLRLVTVVHPGQVPIRDLASELYALTGDPFLGRTVYGHRRFIQTLPKRWQSRFQTTRKSHEGLTFDWISVPDRDIWLPIHQQLIMIIDHNFFNPDVDFLRLVEFLAPAVRSESFRHLSLPCKIWWSNMATRSSRLIPVSVKWKTTVCLALLFEYIIKIELQTAFNVRPIPVSVKQKTTVCSAFLFEHITKIELQRAFNVRPIPVSVKQKNTVCSAFLFDHIIKIELQTAFNVRSITVSANQKTTLRCTFLFEHIIKIELQTAFNVRSEAQDRANYSLCKAENHGSMHLPI
ncbi:hypothetical protein B0H13DRAFT_1891865 [Mycena leptocephala]|nr:hypothetical protein B0H13DRAFT_1891865 [Mycena leptocephala]